MGVGIGGFYLGVSTASVLGSVLYDLHGYTIPFLAMGVVNCAVLVSSFAKLLSRLTLLILKVIITTNID